MTIASLSFLAFGLVAVLAYNVHSSVVWRRTILLVANVGFLSTFSHSISAFVPLAAFLAFGYLGVWAIERSHGKAAYWGIVAGTLLLFVWLKKYTFVPHVSLLRSTAIRDLGLVVHLLPSNAHDHRCERGISPSRARYRLLSELHNKLHDARCGTNSELSRVHRRASRACATASSLSWI